MKGLALATNVLVVLFGLPFLVPALLLAIAGETWSGHIAGVWMLALFVAAVLLLRRFLRQDAGAESPRRTIALAVTALVFPILVLAWLAPPGTTPPDSRVRSRFPGGEGYPRFAISNLVPEIDQVKLGTYLAPVVDPFIDMRAAARIRADTMAIYRPIESDRSFARSARSSGTPTPEAVERVRRIAVAELPVNPDRVFLVGLSNGGTGVTRAARATPTSYAALVFLSAVMETDVLSDEPFVAGWVGRPVLVIHRAKDDCIHEANAAAAVALLRSHGARVTYEVDPTSDHFLFFAKPDWVLGEVARFLER